MHRELCDLHRRTTKLVNDPHRTKNVFKSDFLGGDDGGDVLAYHGNRMGYVFRWPIDADEAH